MSGTRGCPACGTAGSQKSLTVTEMWYRFEESFSYLECGECGTVYIEAVPDDLATYYEPDRYYSLASDPGALLGRPGVREVVRAVGRSALFGRGVLAGGLERLPLRNVYMLIAAFRSVEVSGLPRGEATSVLDVGAGSGLLVYALRLCGMSEVYGIDPFIDHDLTYANGATVRKAELADTDGTHDVIALNHSFEHLPDPGAMLDELRGRLNPDGVAVIRMPTVSSEAYNTYGPEWYSLDAPHHLTVFSRAGMARLCEAHGFAVRRVVDDGNSAQFWASEQIRKGIPLASARSHYVDPRRSVFSAREIWGWERRARRLNAQGRGDQAAWVISPR